MKTSLTRRMLRRRLFIASAFVLVALFALWGVLNFGGGVASQPFEDPGPVVRWGLPVTKLAFNICAAVTIGAFAFAAFILPPISPSYRRVLRIGIVGAASWTVVSVTGLMFALLSLVPISAFDRGFFQQLAYFAQAIPIGQVWLLTAVLTATVTLIALVAHKPVHAVIGMTTAILALLPMALTGHAAGDQGHAAAVTALALHMIGAAVWLGGLILLVVVRNAENHDQVKVIVERYSALALAGFVVVGISGIVVASIQLGTVANTFSAYGLVVLTKGAGTVLLGVAGAWNRVRLIGKLSDPRPVARRAFWLIVSTELLLLGLVSGLAAGLARTPTPEQPVPATFPAAAEAVTGNPTPPEPGLLTLFTQWRLDPLWTMATVAALIFYILGVRRLRVRGQIWPRGRTLAWAAGLAIVFYSTSGSVAAYQEYLDSYNAVSVMLMCLAAPIALVAGRPATLARLAVFRRRDQSIGVAEMAGFFSRIIAVQGSRNPIVWAVLVALSIAGLYFTPWIVSSLRDPFGYQFTVIWFTLLGIGLAGTLIRDRSRAAWIAIGALIAALIIVAFALYTIPETPGTEWFASLELDWRGSGLLNHQSSSYVIAVAAVLWAGVITAVVARVRRCDAFIAEAQEDVVFEEGTK